MKDDELSAIAERWEGVSKGYKKIKFEEAHADMLVLLMEIRKLRPINRDLEIRLKNAELLSKNIGQEMINEIYAVVHKYS